MLIGTEEVSEALLGLCEGRKLVLSLAIEADKILSSSELKSGNTARSISWGTGGSLGHACAELTCWAGNDAQALSKRSAHSIALSFGMA